jgi:hypothetical protein
MRDRPRGVAVAHRIDIRIKASGVTGSEGTGISGALFYFVRMDVYFWNTGDWKHGKMEQ